MVFLLLLSAVAAALELHSLVATNSSVYNFTLQWDGATSGGGGGPRSIVLFRPTGSYMLVDFEVLDAAGAVAIERSQFLLCSDDAMVETPTPLSAVAPLSRRRRLKGRSGGGRSSGGSRSTGGTRSSTSTFSRRTSGVSRTSGFSGGSGRGFRTTSRSRYGSFAGSGYKTPGATAGARTLRARPGGSTRSFTSSKAGQTSSSSFKAKQPGVGAGGSGASVKSSVPSYGYSKARLSASGRFPSGYRATAYGVSGRNALRPGGAVRRYRPHYYPMYYPYYIGMGHGGRYGYGRAGRHRYYDERSEEEACATGVFLFTVTF